MNENDSGVVFPRGGKRTCHLDEVNDIEGDEYPTLVSRFPQQLHIR